MSAANLSYRIEYDTCPENPREQYDHLFTLLFGSNRYAAGDDTIRNDASEEDFPDSIVLPVYAYIHGNIALSPFPFSCPWDSGQMGFAVISRADLLKELGWKRVTAKRWRKLEEILKSELEEYSAYLNGDVYGYVIEDEDGNYIDSCYGYYGYRFCEEEARRMMDYYQNEQAEDAA